MSIAARNTSAALAHQSSQHDAAMEKGAATLEGVGQPRVLDERLIELVECCFWIAFGGKDKPFAAGAQ